MPAATTSTSGASSTPRLGLASSQPLDLTGGAAIRVTATGHTGAGGAGAVGAGGVPVEVVAECVVRAHAGHGASAIELGASVPASVAAQLLASKLIVERGVLPPELAIPPGPYFQELARRGITVSLTTRRLDPINGNRPNDR